MKSKRQLSRIFIGVYILFWFLGPITQLIQIINLNLHIKMGFSEIKILDPSFAWFKADELSLAWADMTTLIAGIIFIIGSFMRRSWSIWFGFYSLAIWSYWPILTQLRWALLEDNGYDVLAQEQAAIFHIYMILFAVFSLFGMFYLWRHRHIYDINTT
jgi:hypothetical protein